ncbi:hypothetical protein Tco_0084476 [Tanacetum coccineum]
MSTSSLQAEKIVESMLTLISDTKLNYKYATEILEMAYMVCCNRCRTPVDTESKLGADGDRVSDLTVYHSLAALKRIFRFVRGTLDYGLQLYSFFTTYLVAYSDADWVGFLTTHKSTFCGWDADWVGFLTTHKSTSGHYVLFGNNLLSWPSKRQLTLSQSSAKAEYCGVTNLVVKTCWFGSFMFLLAISMQMFSYVIHEYDSQRALASSVMKMGRAVKRSCKTYVLYYFFGVEGEGDNIVTTYTHTTLDKERFLKQRAKIEWLQEGDSKSAYFHRSVKARISKGRIDCIMDHENVVYGGDDLPKVFVEHYMNFLGVQATVEDLNHHGLFVRKLHQSKFENMVRILFDEEIRMAMFFIRNDKAPGPDGYTTLLREVNHTILAMLPKVSTPSRVNEFCPISGCNEGLFRKTFYLPKSLYTYHLYRGPPRCAFKIDIQKAYDMANWKVLEDILVGFRFHMIMRRGLRQGDSMSLYHFTLVMEIPTLILKHGLIMFARGDMQSARVLIKALEEFKGVSGLVPSIPKSTIFFCNVPGQVKDCKILVERVRKRLGDWKNKWLSLAGIIHDIEQLLCGFLWCQGDMKRGKAKVSREDLCLLKFEGGLGVRRLDKFIVALMETHIWKLLNHKESLGLSVTPINFNIEVFRTSMYF